MVDLAEQQPGRDAEREIEHGAVRLGHLLAGQQRVGAVVDDLGVARLVIEREEDPSCDEDDECVQRDLAEQE